VICAAQRPWRSMVGYAAKPFKRQSGTSMCMWARAGRQARQGGSVRWKHPPQSIETIWSLDANNLNRGS
jgi:hypothetical protein